jgi:hypothetical protein
MGRCPKDRGVALKLFFGDGLTWFGDGLTWDDACPECYAIEGFLTGMAGL